MKISEKIVINYWINKPQHENIKKIWTIENMWSFNIGGRGQEAGLGEGVGG